MCCVRLMFIVVQREMAETLLAEEIKEAKANYDSALEQVKKERREECGWGGGWVGGLYQYIITARQWIVVISEHCAYFYCPQVSL